MPDVGIFVPAVAVSNPHLCPLDKLLFGEIVQLARQTGFCYAPNSHFATRHGVSNRTVQRSLSLLVQQGLVRIEFDDGHTMRHIFPLTGCDTDVTGYDTDVTGGMTDLSQTYDTTVIQNIKGTQNSKSGSPALHKYGEFGWVKVTDEQHRRLVEEYGEDTIKRTITYVDESAQTTGNKNKWRDWNLVLRKCIRNGWGGITPPAAKPDFKVIGGVKIYD